MTVVVALCIVALCAFAVGLWVGFHWAMRANSQLLLRLADKGALDMDRAKQVMEEDKARYGL